MDHETPGTAELAAAIADLATRYGCTVGCAESLTSGRIAAALGAAPNAGTWFRGGIVAYAADVKYDLLGVPIGPVVTGPAADLMARNVAASLSAELTVAVTGAGGPNEQDGWPAGTVFLAVHDGTGTDVERAYFEGDPAAVVRATVTRALQLLLGRLRHRSVERERQP